MNSKKIPEEIQDCPDNYNEFLPFLNDLLKKLNQQMVRQIINSGEYLFLELCKLVVTEFKKHSQPLTDDLCTLLENVTTFDKAENVF